jgi:hypothetical protein
VRAGPGEDDGVVPDPDEVRVMVIALTAGALVSLYVEQISAITSTLINAALLAAVVRYRNRFLPT